MGEHDFPGPASHVFFSQRLRLHYVDWGNAGAPPLLLLHGGRDHCRNWDWVAAGLRHEWHIIAPDLRGHGDSAWSCDGAYTAPAFIYDLAQLIHQQQLAPVSIIAHSLGGIIALRYAGLYPELVKKLVVIEGLAFPEAAEHEQKPLAERMRRWIEYQRKLSSRTPRRYASLEDAIRRMQEENKHLSPAQARHLTRHGVNQNEDGTYSWKFDNYARVRPPYDIPQADIAALWSNITCPVMLVYGKESWALHPDEAGVTKHFKDVRVASFDHAGHWVHHDQLPLFLALMRDFL